MGPMLEQATLFDLPDPAPPLIKEVEHQSVVDERTLSAHGYKLVTLKELAIRI
ncbi:hypothetical protein ACVIGB_000879 [Bradyrhizobium sp. USDA 4341]